jgi:hypothetical protein
MIQDNGGVFKRSGQGRDFRNLGLEHHGIEDQARRGKTRKSGTKPAIGKQPRCRPAMTGNIGIERSAMPDADKAPGRSFAMSVQHIFDGFSQQQVRMRNNARTGPAARPLETAGLFRKIVNIFSLANRPKVLRAIRPVVRLRLDIDACDHIVPAPLIGKHRFAVIRIKLGDGRLNPEMVMRVDDHAPGVKNHLTIKVHAAQFRHLPYAIILIRRY